MDKEKKSLNGRNEDENSDENHRRFGRVAGPNFGNRIRLGGPR
jgi:hypothetical protein